MTDLRADSMTGEQWVLEERTADPTSTEEGERWLRADLNSGDKIATLRVDVGTTILNVPVFSSGSAVDVSEAMRVQVNGTTAYVPLAPVSDAAYPELRMQHSGATYGFHDAVEISAIPDSAILQVDAKSMSANDGETLSTIPDQTTNGNDLSAVGDPTYQTGSLNSEPTIRFDGGDDGAETGLSPNESSATIIMVLNYQGGSSLSDNEAWHSVDVSDTDGFAFTTGGNYAIRGGSNVLGSTNTDPRVISVQWDSGGDEIIRENGSQTGAGDAGSFTFNGFALAMRGGLNDLFGEWDISFAEVHDGLLSSSALQDRENYAGDRYGITT